MGKQVSLIKFTGRTGDVVGSKGTQGRVILRAYQPDVKNPQTEAQVAQRTRFLTATALAAGFKDALMGLTTAAKSKEITKRNLLVKTLCKASNGIINVGGWDGNTMTSSVDWEKIKLSRNEVSTEVNVAQPSFSEESKVEVTWTGGEANERVIVVVYQPDSNMALTGIASANAGTLTVNTPTNWSGMPVHVYAYVMAFGTEDSAISYDSWWSGNDTLAEAKKSQLESEAQYSATTYLGFGTIA